MLDRGYRPLKSTRRHGTFKALVTCDRRNYLKIDRATGAVITVLGRPRPIQINMSQMKHYAMTCSHEHSHVEKSSCIFHLYYNL